ncbi:MAG: hypothetical protein K0Q68_1892 [Moraxellaceae bacterium]|jgi:hypothetical protein|nr:hypothetical protein [Moraxellaceae bacterium]
MLSRLFSSTPKWQSPKSNKRIEALAELDLATEKDLQILLKLAREDSEPAVRREAVKRLPDPEIIAQIQKRDLDAGVREAATQRLQDLITGQGRSPLTLEQRLAGIRRIGTPSMLVHIVREADHIDLKLAAIAQLNDEIFLDDIARHSSIARLRLAAAERVTTPALLEALAEASKQKDKNVYKAIRARLDESHQQQKDSRALQERREALCEAMEHHARSAMNPLYTAKAESLRQQWQEVQGPEDALLGERFETAFALAWKEINEIASAAQREADATQAREEMQQAVTTLEATLEAWRGQDDFDLPALAATRKTQRLRWELATQLQSPPPALASRYAGTDDALERLEQMLAQWQQDNLVIEASLARLTQAEGDEYKQNHQALQQTLAAYRDYHLPLPELLARFTPSRAERHRDSGSAEKRATGGEAAQQKLRTLLDALDAGITAGSSRDASRLLRKAQEFAREHHLQDARLAELSARLQELKSWAGFAVQPKKEELIGRMQALLAHEMDPDDKADAIHALQDEWKALGVADAAIEQPLWERFKAVGDAAFEPCREHFARQREVRAQNLEKREALCHQLEDYLAALPVEAAAPVDWKQHDAILRAARAEWQHCHPSDRHKTKPLQERFQRTLDALEQRLHVVQQQRETQKRELIQRTRALRESPDLRSACDQAKVFQQDWKAIGPASERVDRKLWQEFRAACDALFGQREAEFKAREAGRDASLQRASELLSAYEQLAGEDNGSSGSAAIEIEEAFLALDLPRDKAQALRQRFQAARQRREQTRQEKAAGNRRQQLENVIRSWEDAARPATQEADKAGQLLLDLEILLELPSPAVLQAARRERQMQRLQTKGLRKGSDETGSLLAELLKTPPIRDEHLPEMAARLRQVLQRTEK